jgi:uncharacterized repeat protein (TIGR03803 family)
LATAADPEGALANLKLIHSFTEIEGAGLGDRLAVGPDGKLYGSAGGGGEHGYGTTFRALPGGKVTRLFSFGAPDTTMVVPGPLTLGGDDRFYGIVKGGGSGRGWGGVFRMNTRGDVEQLHDFTGDTCAYPLAPLAEGSDGNFYGSTSQGGDGGCLFRISPHGRYTLLRMLTTSDGVYPLGPLVESSDGFFYGVLMQLGPRGGGTAFRMSRQGRLHVIHAFERPFDAMVHGGGPYYPVSLLEAPDGFFYGSTQAGGQADQGTVFRMTREGQVDVLHDFAKPEDGALPIGLLRLGADGALYGLTLQGGAHGKGTAYRLTLGGEFSVLHAFNPARDEDASSGGLTELAPGIFYGVNGGGIDHLGALYRLRLK